MNSPEHLKVVALLPMKGNSERVKGKNFRAFNGKPLFRWILDTLLSLDFIDRVVINTDAEGLLREHGLPDDPKILIRDRKKAICGDHVSMNLVIQDDIENIISDCYLMTHVTNPLLSRQSIHNAYLAYSEARQRGEADSLFTVNKFQTRFYDVDCNPINHDPDNLIPTQELTPWYEENSNLYIFTRDSFESTNARIGVSPIFYETRKIESADIDDPEDWTIAESLSKSFDPMVD